MKKLSIILLATLLAVVVAMPAVAADMAVTKSIAAGSTASFTDGAVTQGDFNISISGTWTGTVVLQKSYDRHESGKTDATATWHDVDSYTVIEETAWSEPSRRVYYRIGRKATVTTTGTVVLRLQN